MPRTDAHDKALGVKPTVERIRQSLLNAHRRIFKAAVKSQNNIGTGNPSAADERGSDLGRKFYTDSTRDVVVLGFWAPSFKTPKYVCSTSGMNIARAVKKVAFQVMQRGNSWRAKESAAIFDEFLRDARLLMLDIQKVDPESETRVPRDQHELDMRKMQRTLGVNFGVTEAEARMASYLMQHDVQEVVDVYCTDGPCGPCSRTFAALEPGKQKHRQRFRSMYMNGIVSPTIAEDARAMPALAWRIGYLFYGQAYEVEQEEKSTDLRTLDNAVKAKSIEGYGNL